MQGQQVLRRRIRYKMPQARRGEGWNILERHTLQRLECAKTTYETYILMNLMADSDSDSDADDDNEFGFWFATIIH